MRVLRLVCSILALLWTGEACGRTMPTSPVRCAAARATYAETTYVRINGLPTIGGIIYECIP